ncbi:MAG: hypothetical protein ABSA17_03095 [Rhabdochlamydiaceae bacterium]|jgi:ankyrin repeat protein
MSAVSKASTPKHVELAQPAIARAETKEGSFNAVVQSGDLKAVQVALKTLENQQTITINCFREALPIAAEMGNLPVFDCLKEHKGKNNSHAIKDTPLHLGPSLCRAAANGHVPVVQRILEARVYEGETSIAHSESLPHINPHPARKPQPTSKLPFFLKGMPDLNKYEERSSFIIPGDLLTALRMAALRCHIPVVQVLLERKDLCDRVRKLMTEDPVAKSLPNTVARTAHVLLHERALPPSDIKDLDDKTYLQFTYVTKKPPFRGVDHHLKHGNAAALPGLVIREAAKRGDLYVIQAMMVLMLPFSEADRGQAVQNAAENGHVDIVRVLLDSGNISDVDRDLAAAKSEKRYPAIVELLQKNPRAAIEKALESGQIKL